METAPTLPALRLAEFTIAVDGITGHGASRASLTARTSHGTVASDATRDDLVAFALELLKLSEQMIDDSAYSASDTIRFGAGMVSGRHKDGLLRYYRLRDRLPILTLMQQVLESADDKTASTLLQLLANVTATGNLPIKVEIDLTATQNHDGGEVTH
ncbi:hypothetical protein JWH16_04540 [Xanthomonas campestris pv. campestris]|uniref:hypothetical protein n=1 Tax=Xanthomonas campestris TaxID=339 RepID=UPI001E6032B4|nr:hypothetical protein [Xanthomonas campestris]MCD0253123.1 hypothetical protein [Xanthomonas campestris pv. campestris]